MINKCCFILPYFGKFPNYFPVFLQTCKTNNDFTWLIFTDDDTVYDYPDNVKVIYISFEDFKDKIQNKFEFKVVINEAHKLCDYKPAYGYIFSEYLKEYEFWGHCDIDIIFGNLKKFITDSLLNQYDKLFCLGHMELYRNSDEINAVFMNEYNGRLLYKEAFTSAATLVFDEPFGNGKNGCINDLFIEAGYRIFEEDLSMNFLIAPANFIRTVYRDNDFIKEKRMNALYIWDNGDIYRLICGRDKRIYKEDIMYMHFQARKMLIKYNVESDNKFKILGNGFYEIDKIPKRYSEFRHERKTIFSLRYIKTICRWKKNGLKRRIKSLRYIILYK